MVKKRIFQSHVCVSFQEPFKQSHMKLFMILFGFRRWIRIRRSQPFFQIALASAVCIFTTKGKFFFLAARSSLLNEKRPSPSPPPSSTSSSSLLRGSTSLFWPFFLRGLAAFKEGYLPESRHPESLVDYWPSLKRPSFGRRGGKTFYSVQPFKTLSVFAGIFEALSTIQPR